MQAAVLGLFAFVTFVLIIQRIAKRNEHHSGPCCIDPLRSKMRTCEDGSLEAQCCLGECRLWNEVKEP